MTIFRSSLLLLACASLGACGPTTAQKAEADARNEAARSEAAQREADLNQVRSDLRNMADIQARMRNLADETLERVEAERRRDGAAAATNQPGP